VATGIGGNEYTWHLDGAPGSQGFKGLIRLEASDGFNQGQDQSDGFFSLEGKPPVAVILSPDEGQGFLQCGRVHLSGAAQDLEGAISEVEWSLDGQTIGSQAEMDIGSLPAGQHSLTFMATDADGGWDVSETGFTVLADTDCDGMSDEFEQLYSLQPGNAEDAALDSDQDGVVSQDEYRYGLDPTNPDSDADGYSDGFEIAHGSNPTDPSSTPVIKTYLPMMLRYP
jgi:hypothetical protein